MEIFVNRIGLKTFWVIIYGQWSTILFCREIRASTSVQAVKQALKQMEKKNATP